MALEIEIQSESIRLGQLLKLAGVIDGGGEAKALLEDQAALVNGERETRRGRKLKPGDEVRVGDHQLLVTAAARRG